MLDTVVAPRHRHTRPSRPVLDNQRLLSANQAAREFGFAYSTLRDLAFKGLIPVVKFDDGKFARWFFDRKDLERLIEQSKAIIA